MCACVYIFPTKAAVCGSPKNNYNPQKCVACFYALYYTADITHVHAHKPILDHFARQSAAVLSGFDSKEHQYIILLALISAVFAWVCECSLPPKRSLL